MKRTILVADEDDALVQRIGCSLEENGYGVRFARSGEEVLSRIRIETIDLLILGDTLRER